MGLLVRSWISFIKIYYIWKDGKWQSIQIYLEYIELPVFWCWWAHFHRKRKGSLLHSFETFKSFSLTDLSVAAIDELLGLILLSSL